MGWRGEEDNVAAGRVAVGKWRVEVHLAQNKNRNVQKILQNPNFFLYGLRLDNIFLDKKDRRQPGYKYEYLVKKLLTKLYTQITELKLEAPFYMEYLIKMF